MEDRKTAAAIQRLKRGDIEGLAALVERYQVRAVRAAYLITYDRALAEDVVQTAFVRIYERIAQFDDNRPFEPWFMRVVMNAALQAIKQRQRVLSLDGNDYDTSFTDLIADDMPNPENAAEASEMREAVRDALAALSPDQRAVIVLRYYLEYSEQELAEEFNTPPGTIKWRLHTARKQLSVLLRHFSKPLAAKKQEV